MNKYRRIEINAYRRRMTVISGEWQPDVVSAALPVETDDGVSLVDCDLDVPIAPDSPEGQVLLAEAVRCLQRRLSPEAQPSFSTCQNNSTINTSSRSSLSFRLRSLSHVILGILRFARRQQGKDPKQHSSEQDSA